METEVTTDLLKELVRLFFGSNWKIADYTLYPLTEDKNRKVFIRLELWWDGDLVNHVEKSFEVSEAIPGLVRPQVTRAVAEIRHDPLVNARPMN